MPKIQIEIGADNSDLEKKISQSKSLLKKLEAEKDIQIGLGLDTKALDTQISATKTKLSGLEAQMNKATGATNNFNKSTANGSNTLMNFSRIAQDAPFGIIGIGNNLTATAESFGHLSKQAGGAGGAIKAILSSLSGIGGILLAVSLVTTGLTIMAQQGLTLGDVFEKITGKFDQAARDIKTAYEESSKAALGEVASLKALISVAQDETVSRRERLQAVKDIQKQYPAYFGNLSTEQIMYGDLSKEINDVSKALINKAVATKISEKAGDTQYKILTLNAQLIKDKEILTKAEERLQKASTSGATSQTLATLSNELQRAKSNVDNTRVAWLQATGQAKQYQDVLKKFAGTKTAENANESDQAAAAAAAKAAADAKAKAAAKAAAEAAKQREKELKELEAYNKSVLDGQNKLAAATALAKSAEYAAEKERKQKSLDDITAMVEAHENFLANVGKTEAQKKTAADQAVYSARLAQLKTFLDQKLITQEEYNALEFEAAKNASAILSQFNDDANSLVQGGLQETFSSLGEAIGTALASGGNVLSAMGQSILQSLGKFISEMGGLLIKYGTLAVLKGTLDEAIKKGGKVAIVAGLGAIAVGVALKAVGSAMSAKVGGQGGGQTSTAGGGTSTNTGADSFRTSGSSVSGVTNNSGGTVVFEIAGQKLIGVLNNTTQGNLRLGGSGLVG